jgi:hypothetical protein
MISQLIIEKIDALRAGGQVAPLLITEMQACEVYGSIFWEDIISLDDLETRGVTDFLYYDCGDKKARHHMAEIVRKHVETLYQKPSGDILVALFRHIDILTDTSANALLRLFEDVPWQLLILVTSQAPQKIISTLKSRMILLAPSIVWWGENPHKNAVDAYVAGDPEPLFALTLVSSREWKFSRDDALWVIQGLQDAIKCGTLSPRHARRISETRVLLETTNTIAKYLIDQLLISLSCE